MFPGLVIMQLTGQWVSIICNQGPHGDLATGKASLHTRLCEESWVEYLYVV